MSERGRARRRERTPTLMLVGDEDGDLEVSRIEVSLRIEDADEALREQPDLYYRAALRIARLEAQVAAAEMSARAAVNRTTLALRLASVDRHVPRGEEEIAARARQDSEVDAAERRVGELRRRLFAARSLEAAYEQRLRCLEVLGRR